MARACARVRACSLQSQPAHEQSAEGAPLRSAPPAPPQAHLPPRSASQAPRWKRQPRPYCTGVAKAQRSAWSRGSPSTCALKKERDGGVPRHGMWESARVQSLHPAGVQRLRVQDMTGLAWAGLGWERCAHALTLCPASQAAAAGQAMGSSMDDRKTGSVRAADSRAAPRQRAASARPASTKSAGEGLQRREYGWVGGLIQVRLCRQPAAAQAPSAAVCTPGTLHCRRPGTACPPASQTARQLAPPQQASRTQALLRVGLCGEAAGAHRLQQVARPGGIWVKAHLLLTRGWVGWGGAGQGEMGRAGRRAMHASEQGSAAIGPAASPAPAPLPEHPPQRCAPPRTSTTPVSRLTEASSTPATWRRARSTAGRGRSARWQWWVVAWACMWVGSATKHAAPQVLHRRCYLAPRFPPLLAPPSCNRKMAGGAPVPEQEEQVMPPTCRRATFTSSCPSTEASNPAPSTAATRSAGVQVPSPQCTSAWARVRLTVAPTTPGTAASAASTAPEHAAQAMPPIDSLTARVSAARGR